MEADRSQSSENLLSPDQEGVASKHSPHGGRDQVGGAISRHKRSRSEGALARTSLRSNSSCRSVGWEESTLGTKIWVPLFFGQLKEQLYM